MGQSCSASKKVDRFLEVGRRLVTMVSEGLACHGWICLLSVPNMPM